MGVSNNPYPQPNLPSPLHSYNKNAWMQQNCQNGCDTYYSLSPFILMLCCNIKQGVLSDEDL